MKRRNIIPVVMMLLSMSSFIVHPKASSDVMSMEIKMAAQTGMFVQILEPYEEHLLDPAVKEYFEPLQDETIAMEFAETILSELQRYRLDVLQKMNIRFYLVQSKTNISGVTLLTNPKTNCEIYLSTSPRRSSIQERSTLHHEIFHCYDTTDKIASWSELFNTSTHVSNTWGTVLDDTITIDYAGEERAEYFAWTLINADRRFHDDAQQEQKQQAILSDIFELITDTSTLPKQQTYVIRTWQAGRIQKISEVTATSTPVRQFEFDYVNNTYIMIDHLTKERLVVPIT